MNIYTYKVLILLLFSQCAGKEDHYSIANISIWSDICNINKITHTDKYEITLDIEAHKNDIRASMKDTILIDETEDKKIKMFAIFDGHGDSTVYGSDVSQYLKDSFSKFLFSKLKGVMIGDYPKVVKKVFLEFDKKMFDLNLNSGSTANIILLVNNHLISINLGDSRNIILKNDKKIFESKDHKPNDNEMSRIEKAGGVLNNGRYIYWKDLNFGGINISRCFGDFELKTTKSGNNVYNEKNPIISITPDIDIIKIDAGSSYKILLACDGLWDNNSTKSIIELFLKGKHKIRDLILSKKCEHDNTSAVMVQLQLK